MVMDGKCEFLPVFVEFALDALSVILCCLHENPVSFDSVKRCLFDLCTDFINA